MGLDTECDLAIQADGLGRVAEVIARFRNSLLAEHLAVTPERVAEVLAQMPSLCSAIDSLHGESRTLQPLPDEPAARLDSALASSASVDLERPAEPSSILAAILPREREPAGRSVLRAAVVLGMIGSTLFTWLSRFSVDDGGGVGIPNDKGDQAP